MRLKEPLNPSTGGLSQAGMLCPQPLGGTVLRGILCSSQMNGWEQLWFKALFPGLFWRIPSQSNVVSH